MLQLDGSYTTNFLVSRCDQYVSQRLWVELGEGDERRPKSAELCLHYPIPIWLLQPEHFCFYLSICEDYAYYLF